MISSNKIINLLNNQNKRDQQWVTKALLKRGIDVSSMKTIHSPSWFTSLSKEPDVIIDSVLSQQPKDIRQAFYAQTNKNPSPVNSTKLNGSVKALIAQRWFEQQSLSFTDLLERTDG